jgi:hypothetical protein
LSTPGSSFEDLNPQRSRLLGLVAIPRLHDRLGLFVGGQELDGLLG